MLAQGGAIDMTTPISDIASVIHHGGKHTVTGSCHELKLPHGSILIDCGLFQGKDIHFGNRKASLDIEFPISPDSFSYRPYWTPTLVTGCWI